MSMLAIPGLYVERLSARRIRGDGVVVGKTRDTWHIKLVATPASEDWIDSEILGLTRLISNM